MADLQAYFVKFHNDIKVDPEALVQKRDILLDKIRKSLKDKKRPLFDLVNQGSYIYGVGIEPIGDLEHDIDVGLAFNIRLKDYPDATVVRQWVMDAIGEHTDKVVQKGPCIRVYYAAGYHVDLVVYAKFKDDDSREQFQLALDNGEWRPSDPKRLKEIIYQARDKFKATKLNGSGADQLQRVVRYLKRWNDEAIPRESDDKPCGLALLLFTIANLWPTTDALGKSNDLAATLAVAQAAANTLGRIIAKKPTPEYDDVFAKISDQEMIALKNRFRALANALVSARQARDLDNACTELRKVFGDDFPTPETLRKSEFNSLDGGMAVETDAERTAKVAAIQSIVDRNTSVPKPWSRD